MWGLTFHILVIALLFGLFGVPATIVRVLAAWKEALVVLLFAVLALRTVAGRGARSAIGAADLCATALLLSAAVALLTENAVFAATITTSAGLLGFRDAAIFLLLYFVGRGTPAVADDPALFRRAFRILVLISALAILEQIFITPRMLVALGVARYVQQFLGTQAFTTGNVYGLPDNYWSLMGGHVVRRSGSVFLSGQGFATAFLVLLPPATLWALDRNAPRPALRHIAYVVIWAGLLVSFTRAATVACAMELAIIQLLNRRPTGLALAATAGLVATAIAVVAVPGLATFLIQTVTWQTGSSSSHLKDWTAGVIALLQQPWGHGLATTDQSAVRAGLTPITSDNLFLKYGVELGAPALAALLGFFGTVALAAWRGGQSARCPVQRQFAIMVLAMTVGIVFDGATGVVFNNPIVSYLYFWFAGTAVAIASRRTATVPAPLPVHA